MLSPRCFPMNITYRLLYRFYRLFSGARYWATRRFTRAGLVVLGALGVAAIPGLDPESSVGYQGFTLSLAPWDCALPRRHPRAGRPARAGSRAEASAVAAEPARVAEALSVAAHRAARRAPVPARRRGAGVQRRAKRPVRLVARVSARRSDPTFALAQLGQNRQAHRHGIRGRIFRGPRGGAGHVHRPASHGGV